jgi:hypothetical protein
MTAPERSLAQRRAALKRANDVRAKRAKLKRDLGGGRRTIHALLKNPPDYIETMKLFDLMLHLPKYGRVKVNKALTQCRISPSKTIGGLSQRQRDEVIALLRRGGPSAPLVVPPRRLSVRPRKVHMTTFARHGAHDTACGRLLPSRETTRNAAAVTCGSCLVQMRANARGAVAA